MQAALAESSHSSLVTPNTANLQRFKAVAAMKYSSTGLLLQYSWKKREEACPLLIQALDDYCLKWDATSGASEKARRHL